MISLFRKRPATAVEIGSENTMPSAFQNEQENPQTLKIDLSSGNELSPEGKIFCARLCTQNFSQVLNLPQTKEEVNQPQNYEFPKRIDLPKMLAIYQKVELEEAALLGVKQHLSKTQQELQDKIFKEAHRKKMNINTLRSEIHSLENKCKELLEAVSNP